MVTMNDLVLRFVKETGMTAKNYSSEFRKWKDDLLLEKLSEENEVANLFADKHE